MRDRSRLTGKAKQRVKPHSEAHAMLPGQAVSRDPFAATPDKMLPFGACFGERNGAAA